MTSPDAGADGGVCCEETPPSPVIQLLAEPELYRINVPLKENPLKNLNCYVLRSAGRTLVIDTGFDRPECSRAIWDGLARLNVDLTHTALFLTHLHGDHCGLAYEFSDRGIPIYLSQTDYNCILEYRQLENIRALAQRFCREGFPIKILGLPPPERWTRLCFEDTPLFPATPLHHGSLLRLGRWTLRCILTPGHTPGHTCLYLEEQQILFSGDHILFDITPNIGVWNQMTNSLEDYLRSLRGLCTLPVRATFSAHRSGTGELRPRIEALFAHHRQRLHEVLDAVTKEPGQNAYQLAGVLRWSVRGLDWAQVFPYQKLFAMGETLAHLDWLLAAGCLVRSESDTYTPTGQPVPPV